jgi:UDP-N-acetylmuramoyl-tripeptide--D-alanyl-D-alanine ligase
MERITLKTVAQWANGELLQGPPDAAVTAVSTDSRTLRAGELFVALRGENFDGHKFVGDVAARGAAGAIVESAFRLSAPTESQRGADSTFALIAVADTLRALQDVAAAYRRGLASLKVVGITGSNGKTSTKDFTASVLGERFRVTKTEGNLNNHIGLPLTMLRVSASDQIGVFEMGMNHPGEIEPLAKMAAPDVAIITNVGRAHIGFMGSREAIAREKGMLAEVVGEDGHVILNAECEFSKGIAARTKAHVIFAGIGHGDVRVTEIRPQAEGSQFTLQAGGQSVEGWLAVPGVHMIQNAALAVAAGRIFGLTLAECAIGLQKVRLTKGRLEQKTVRGIRVIDDTYNANPDSMIAALRTLAQTPARGRRIAVLGNMGELGAESERGHRQVGETAAREGANCVVSVGPEAALITDAARENGVQETFNVESTDAAAELLRKIAQPGDVVLIKGSRSARMERIVEALAQP